jgi:hypothetical protein
LTIVPVTELVPRFAFVPFGRLRFTANVSSASRNVSPMTRTAIVFVVWPGAKATLPDAAT